MSSKLLLIKNCGIISNVNIPHSNFDTVRMFTTCDKLLLNFSEYEGQRSFVHFSKKDKFFLNLLFLPKNSFWLF